MGWLQLYYEQMNNKSSFVTIIAPELLTFRLLLANKYKCF